jgi:predicted MFS family arabinose efflux permease
VVETTLLAFATASFLVALDRAIFSPLLPEMASDLNTSVGRAGLGVTAYVLPYGIFQLLFGPLGDKIGRVQVTRWCFLIFALGTGLSGIVPSLTTLILLRAATGLCAAAVIPLALAYIGDAVPYESRQRAITNLMGATATGGALSTAVGGMLGSLFSWRLVFALYGVIALLIAAYFFRLPVDPPKRSAGTTKASGFRDVLANGRARLIYGLVAIEGVVVLGAFTYLGAYLHEEFGLDYFVTGLILACYGLGTLMTSRLLFPLILHRVSERQLVLAGGLSLGFAYLALAPLPWWPLAIPPMLLMGMGFALFHSTLQTRTTELAPEARGTAVSMFAFCAFVGGGIGSAGFGWMVEATGYGPFLVVSGLLMLVIGVIAAIRW